MHSSDEIKFFPREKNFRLRGLETTRLDTFIDAAFAFATTMLVISIGNIPNSFAELILALKRIPAFLASFISVVFIWLGHRKWSRRYGIEDGYTMILSFGLIFILMIYVYPLRLVFSALFSWVSGNFFPSEFLIKSSSEMSNLFIFYGLGFAAISAMLGLLFLRSYKLKVELFLDEAEIILTRYEITAWSVMGGTAILSSLFAFIMPLQIAVFAGFVYGILPILMPIISIKYSKKLERILKKDIGVIHDN